MNSKKKEKRYYIDINPETKRKLNELFSRYEVPYGFRLKAFSQIFEEALPRLEDALLKHSKILAEENTNV